MGAIWGGLTQGIGGNILPPCEPLPDCIPPQQGVARSLGDPLPAGTVVPCTLLARGSHGTQRDKESTSCSPRSPWPPWPPPINLSGGSFWSVLLVDLLILLVILLVFTNITNITSKFTNILE